MCRRGLRRVAKILTLHSGLTQRLDDFSTFTCRHFPNFCETVAFTTASSTSNKFCDHIVFKQGKLVLPTQFGPCATVFPFVAIRARRGLLCCSHDLNLWRAFVYIKIVITLRVPKDIKNPVGEVQIKKIWANYVIQFTSAESK